MAKKPVKKKKSKKPSALKVQSAIADNNRLNPSIDHVRVAMKEVKPSIPHASHHLLQLASTLLAIATGIAVLFGFCMALLPGGQNAVPAMGGVLQAVAPLHTAQIVFFLDILFPITFGVGFALLATAFQNRGNRPLVRMILTMLIFVVLADFSENALVFKALTGGEVFAIQWPLTVIKYAMLGISAVLLSCIMIIQGTIGVISMLFLRFFFPISIAALVAGIGGRFGADLIGATFPLGLLLLAIYANQVSHQN